MTSPSTLAPGGPASIRPVVQSDLLRRGGWRVLHAEGLVSTATLATAFAVVVSILAYAPATVVVAIAVDSIVVAAAIFAILHQRLAVVVVRTKMRAGRGRGDPPQALPYAHVARPLATTLAVGV